MRLTNGKPLKEEDRTIDDLDKHILQQMSRGISSYEDLSRECKVTRSTVYRRVAQLEKDGFIRRITRTVVDYEKLDIVTLCFACRISQTTLKKASATLKVHRRVKLMWRTYGDHNVIFIVFCEKGSEGEIIGEIRTILEKCGATDVSVSVGFMWEKMDFTPFSNDLQEDKQLKLYYSEDERIMRRSIVKD